MIDIISLTEGLDMGVLSTDTSKAGNILSVQLGSLEYQPDLGIDLDYFFNPDFQYQNEAFKSYLIEVLAARSINVASVTDTVENLFREYVFRIKDSENSTSLVVR
jgi:hypothetical protein